MSAELYDAEVAGALARPAVDILPSAEALKGKAPAPEAPAFPPPMAAPPSAQAAGTDVPISHTWSPPAIPEAATTDAPKKVFGMSLRRAKKDAEPEPPAGWAGSPEAAAFPPPVAVQDPAIVPEPETAEWAAPPVHPVVDMDVDGAWGPPAEAPAPIVEPSEADKTAEEIRALHALCEASERQRADAEARAGQAVAYAQQAQGQMEGAHSQLQAAQMAMQNAEARAQQAEAKARTTANEAQDWQIRHREAETTIAELAQSVAGAEQRVAELRTTMDALVAERDDLLQSLEDVTRPEHAPTER